MLANKDLKNARTEINQLEASNATLQDQVAALKDTVDIKKERINLVGLLSISFLPTTSLLTDQIRIPSLPTTLSLNSTPKMMFSARQFAR
jgi:hypothetical protein